MYSQTIGEIYFPRKEDTAVYEYPSRSGKLCDIYPHTVLRVTRERNEWVRVNITGWVKKSDLRLKEDILEIKSVEKSLLPADPAQGHISEKIQFKIKTENISKNPIQSWAGQLIIKNIIEEPLFSVRLRSDNLNVSSGEESSLDLVLQEAQFENRNNYEHIKRAKEESLNFDLKIFDVKYIP